MGYNDGWRVHDRLRLAADLTGDGTADLVGFRNDGVWAHLNDGNGNFAGVQKVVAGLRRQRRLAQRAACPARRGPERERRCRPDRVGNNAVWVYLNDGHGNFGTVQKAVADVAYDGGWRVDQHLRLVADIAGEGRADLVAFGNDAVWFYPNDGQGNFGGVRKAVSGFNVNAGWRVDSHPRFVADLTGDGALTNAQLGALFLPERAVGHHVSVVLRKVGEPSRSCVAAARRRAICPLTESTAYPG